jgi:Tol biopolymer transport system component
VSAWPRRFAALPIVVVVIATASPVSATYQGANGEIAYARYGGKQVPSTLRTIEPNGDPGRTLARPRIGLPDAEWSADGTQVAMVLGKEPNRIVMLDVATEERSLVIKSDDVPDTRFVESLGISPDGDAIVFCAVRRGSGTTLFTIGADGSALTDISGDHDDCQPDWGPTDRSAAEETGWLGRIVTMNPDGSDRVVVIRGRDADRAVFFSGPSWSPDGTRIVVGSTSLHERRPDLWIVDADGSDITPLTDTPRLTEFAPIFSPDGARIAFLFDDSQEGYGFSDIFTMAADGSDVQRLTHTPKRREFPRSWQAVSP